LHSGAEIAILSHKTLCIVMFWDFEKPNSKVSLLSQDYQLAGSLQMRTDST
jgi:hypothetical protein